MPDDDPENIELEHDVRQLLHDLGALRRSGDLAPAELDRTAQVASTALAAILSRAGGETAQQHASRRPPIRQNDRLRPNGRDSARRPRRGWVLAAAAVLAAAIASVPVVRLLSQQQDPVMASTPAVLQRDPGVREYTRAAAQVLAGLTEASARQVNAAFTERLASRSQEVTEIISNRTRLQNESDKLLAAHFADAIDLDTLKRHQDRIRTGLAEIDRQLADEHDQHAAQRKHLGTALRLLTRCETRYQQSDEHGKRLANQTFFERIYIGEDDPTTIELAEPFEALTPTAASHVGCSDKTTLVGAEGLEPPTSCL